MAILYVIVLGLAVCTAQEIPSPGGYCGRGAPSCTDYEVLLLRLSDMENAMSILTRKTAPTGNIKHTY
jgi:hypothetical protein